MDARSCTPWSVAPWSSPDTRSPWCSARTPRNSRRCCATRPAGIAVNRDWAEGIASSIREGIAHAPSTADGVLIALADQAAVTTEDLRRLAGVWRRAPASIAAAQYAGGVGVPAIFPRWCFRELNELRGDRGAQVLLHRHVDRLVRLPMPSAELDIDRPEDLLALEENTRAQAARNPESLDYLARDQRQHARDRKCQHDEACTARWPAPARPRA